MTNQILKQCDGKINQHGWCEKCYQPAHTTSAQCNRYLPLEQLQQPIVMGRSELLLAFVRWKNEKNGNWLSRIDEKDVDDFLKASNSP